MKKTLLAVMALVSLCSYAQLPTEGFETPWTGNPAAPPGWIVVNEFGPNITWQQTVPGSTQEPPFGGAGAAAYLARENVSSALPSPKDWLISPPFVVPQNAELQFQSRLTIPGDQGSIYRVLIGSDFADLTSFTEIYSVTELEINPVQTDYLLKNVSIPLEYAGMNMHIAFVMEGDDGDRWLIDNISIYALCDVPVISSSSSNETSATFVWSDTGAVGYEYQFIPVNSAPSDIAGAYVLNNTATVVLPAAITTNYKFYVRALCADGGKSMWSLPLEIDLGYNSVHGIVRYDANGDGICNDDDEVLPYLTIEVQLDGVYIYTIVTDQNGEYDLYEIPDGVHTISLEMESSLQFPELPVYNEEIEFTQIINEHSIEHCLPQPLAPDDLSVSIVTFQDPRPGFNIYYTVRVQNYSDEANSGISASLTFDSTRMEFVSSTLPVTVLGNVVSIPVGDIDAFTGINTSILFHMKEPPVNQLDDEIVFTAALLGSDDDEDVSNNSDVYHDILVNSYDPNDINVHEGSRIYEAQADDYLTYTIRFQNTGTAPAQNIRLENPLSDLLDWNTVKPIASSHEYKMIRNGNMLEFDYKDIFLADSISNEPESHGYVTYKIKPKSTFGLGDTVYNQAHIYFDFNPAIDTNIAETQVIALVGLNDNALAIAKLYPNPVKDQLHIEVTQGELQSITIHDINGRLCLSANVNIIDTNTLSSGIYLVKVTTDAGNANYKLIKQ